MLGALVDTAKTNHFATDRTELLKQHHQWFLLLKKIKRRIYALANSQKIRHIVMDRTINNKDLAFILRSK
jgi:hypothetical protein